MLVEFKKEARENEYGTEYGTRYEITGPLGIDFLTLQEELIQEEIGEDWYYGNQRDIWSQVSIADGRVDYTKLRRRVEDHLRKGTNKEIFGVAVKLGIKLT